MQYACFTCRKVFKKFSSPQNDGFVCPQCSQPMAMMGTAFRAPKQSNVDQWKKAELLVAAGFLFHKDSGPSPQTLKNVPAFLEAHRRAKRSPGERLLDEIKERAAGPITPVTKAKNQGRVKRLNLEGRPSFELAGRELRSWSRVLVKVGARWREGTFRYTGDGAKFVEPHVMVDNTAGMVGHRVFVTQYTVLRWPD